MSNLKSLTTDAGPLSPGFSPGRKQYSLRVPHRTDALRLSAAPEDQNARITVGGSSPTAPIPLEIGRSLITVEVAVPDAQSSGSYEVKVVRGHPTPDWVQISESAPWQPRDSAGELVFADRMWLFGGYLPELIADVWSSANGVDWAQVGTIPAAEGINIPVNWVHHGRMWIASNDGQLFSSADGSSWILVNKNPPWKGRYATGGAVFADRMWAMGGMGGGIHSDIWSSADGKDWQLESAEAPWSRRQLFSMLVPHADRLWILGGGITTYHPFRAYTDVWSSPDGRNWTRVIEQAPWPARIWSSAVSYQNRLWVLGGFRAEPTWNNFDDVWYSADGVNWHQLLTEHIWSPRHELSAYVHDGKLWVAGGNAWPLQNDVWSLEIPGLTFVTQPVVEEFATARYTYWARADFNRSCEPVRYQLIEGPDWLSVDAETGTVTGTPTVPGEVSIILEARDSAGETALQTYALHIIPVS